MGASGKGQAMLDNFPAMSSQENLYQHCWDASCALLNDLQKEFEGQFQNMTSLYNKFQAFLADILSASRRHDFHTDWTDQDAGHHNAQAEVWRYWCTRVFTSFLPYTHLLHCVSWENLHHKWKRLFVWAAFFDEQEQVVPAFKNDLCTFAVDYKDCISPGCSGAHSCLCRSEAIAMHQASICGGSSVLVSGNEVFLGAIFPRSTPPFRLSH